MIKLAIFLIASLAIVFLSKRSLAHPRSHGFYRFFAFELLVILILLNIGHWIREPWSGRQIVTWLLLGASIAFAVEGFRLLLRVGRPAEGGSSSPNFAFENTTELVTVGLYRYVRHPMYASLLFLGWGAWLKNPSWLATIAVVGATVFLVAAAKAEETENIERFGESYSQYRRGTKMFVPFVV